MGIELLRLSKPRTLALNQNNGFNRDPQQNACTTGTKGRIRDERERRADWATAWRVQAIISAAIVKQILLTGNLDGCLELWCGLEPAPRWDKRES